jgi:sugar phosphate isomerase/epimerase
MPYPFRFAICNEVYEKRPFAEACKSIRKAGYTGIEIAPFTLADDPRAIPPDRRQQFAATIQGEGLKFVGLHWLMVGPKDLHVTTPDKAVRERSWQYVRYLVDLCADLGPGGVMVFGSPKQRATTGGLSREEATRHFVEGLAGVAPYAAERGVTVLLEALPAPDNDVVTTLDEAAAIVRQIACPGLRTMFDSHNAVNEAERHAVLVDRHFDLIRHVHLNELDGRHPGTGSYDFKPVLDVLARRGYQGWLSAEVFDFTPGADRIAVDSLRFLEAQTEQIS